MVKWFFVGSGIIMALVLVRMFAPSLFANGFQVGTHFLPHAFIIGGIVLYLGYKLKSK